MAVQRLISSHIQSLDKSIINMSEVVITKVATAMRCNCGHLWLTTSRSKYPTCPRCHIPISRKKHAAILESETARKQKERGAKFEARTQNSAKQEGESHNEVQGRST